MNKAKSFVKTLIGANGVKALKSFRSNIWYVKAKVLGYHEKYTKNEQAVQQMRVYGQPDRHIFFGYYDLPQINDNKSLLLVNNVDIKAMEGKDVAKIECVDLRSDRFITIAETKAWCWQQGSRLRWHPTEHDCILFNNSDGKHYSCEIWRVSDKKKIDEIPYALYDVDSSFRYGITLNFTRLQYFRPGYGYCNVMDSDIQKKIPENDGVYLVDLQSKTTKLLISLDQLASTVENGENYYHYVNHLSFSKTGKKFMFFHVWTNGVGMDWKLRLYVANTDGTELKYIETDETYSHYSWKNDSELLLAAMGDGNTYVYSIYNAETGECRHITSEQLKKDGHPSWVKGKDRFITDISDLTKTKNCMQSLYTINQDGTGYEELLNIYSCPLMTGDRRCDLHPRITSDGQMISMDSTCFGKKRSAILLELKKEL